MIDNFILQYATNSGTVGGNAYIKSTLTNVPTPAYKLSDIVLLTNDGELPMFFIILGNIVMYIRLILTITTEKEHRIQENLRNMGMNVITNIMATWFFRSCTHLFISIIWG